MPTFAPAYRPTKAQQAFLTHEQKRQAKKRKRDDDEDDNSLFPSTVKAEEITIKTEETTVTTESSAAKEETVNIPEIKIENPLEVESKIEEQKVEEDKSEAPETGGCQIDI